MDVRFAILKFCTPFSYTFLSPSSITLNCNNFVEANLLYPSKQTAYTNICWTVLMSSALNIILSHNEQLPDRLQHHLLRVGATKSDIPTENK
jgi:hypothetical protein